MVSFPKQPQQDERTERTERTERIIIDVPLDYSALFNTLIDAFQQSAYHKGKERHGNGLPFVDQPIFTIGKLFGPGFAGGQATKKLQEAIGMAERGDREAARKEALGAIVYAASLAHLWKE